MVAKHFKKEQIWLALFTLYHTYIFQLWCLQCVDVGGGGRVGQVPFRVSDKCQQIEWPVSVWLTWAWKILPTCPLPIWVPRKTNMEQNLILSSSVFRFPFAVNLFFISKHASFIIITHTNTHTHSLFVSWWRTSRTVHLISFTHAMCVHTGYKKWMWIWFLLTKPSHLWAESRSQS